ncbi:MAG: DUF4321 domain-containing protein [Eubacteriales bacterium]|jgi:hypothetical protein
MKMKNTFMFWVTILTGLILGGLLGELASKVSFLSFLNYGKSIGISGQSPMVMDLSVAKLVFGVELRLTIASILGLITSIIIYKKVL